MKHILTLGLIICGALMLQFCSTARSAAKSKEMQPAEGISYTHDIAPIMQSRCTPCHYPDGGKVKFLDTHNAVSSNIDDIIYRVRLPHDDADFMPFKSKKEPLSDSLVQVLVAWKASGMGE